MINIKWFYFVICLTLFSSCANNTKKAEEVADIFDVYVRCNQSHGEYIARVSSLSEGEVDPLKDGVKIADEIHYGLTVKNNNYYYLNEKTNYIKKYQIKDRLFTAADSVPVTDIECLESILWISNDTLLMVGLNKDLIRPSYALLNTSNMSLISEGTISIPNPELISWTTIGFLQRRNSELFIAFYSKPKKNDADSIVDKTSIAVIDFPEMQTQRIETTKRLGRTLNDNRYQPSSIQTEDGIIYFISSGSDRLLDHNDQNKGYASGICRIKNGETSVDPDYFINTNLNLPNGHVYGIWYIGNGSAIIKCDVPKRVQNWDDYDEYVYRYYDVDLNTKNITPIDIPLDRGWYLDNVLVENGLVYIANKSESGENYIWLYNPINKNTRKGLKVNGDFHNFGRINKIK